MPIVYADVLFFVNIIINGLLLITCGKITGVQMKWWRLALATFVGSLYAVLAFVPALSPLYILPSKIMLCAAILAIAFHMRTWMDFFKISGIFYLICFVFGGSVMAIFYFTNAAALLDGVMSGRVIYFNLPMSLLIFTAAGAGGTIVLIASSLKKYLARQGICGRMKIVMGTHSASMDVLFDTGNQLTDPISGRYVAVAEMDSLKEILPPDLCLALLENNADRFLTTGDPAWLSKIHMIPFSSVGVQSGMLLGIRPDNVYILPDEREGKCCDCIVGIYPGRLKNSHGYKAVVNPEVLI